MHVRGCVSQITQGGSTEFPHILSALHAVVEAQVRLRSAVYLFGNSFGILLEAEGDLLQGIFLERGIFRNTEVPVLLVGKKRAIMTGNAPGFTLK